MAIKLRPDVYDTLGNGLIEHVFVNICCSSVGDQVACASAGRLVVVGSVFGWPTRRPTRPNIHPC